MGMQATLNALQRLSEISALAGMKGRINDERAHFEMGFELDGGRRQMVYVRYVGTAGDREVVTFLSPARVIKKGLLKDISRDTAIELLKRNQRSMFARFGLQEYDSELLVLASIDHLLDTLDPAEFEAAAWTVAIAADRYEREHGGDDF